MNLEHTTLQVVYQDAAISPVPAEESAVDDFAVLLYTHSATQGEIEFSGQGKISLCLSVARTGM
jgi:hypothetical protein